MYMIDSYTDILEYFWCMHNVIIILIIIITVFTWLNTAEFITLNLKFDAVSVQIRPLLIAHKRCLRSYF